MCTIAVDVVLFSSVHTSARSVNVAKVTGRTLKWAGNTEKGNRSTKLCEILKVREQRAKFVGP
jgi:hypothetical protein